MDVGFFFLNSLGSVGKRLMSLDSRVCTARRTLVLPQVMQAAMPRCKGLKWARIAGDCSTVSKKLRISSPVQMFEKLAWLGCSYKKKKKKRVIQSMISLSRDITEAFLLKEV